MHSLVRKLHRLRLVLLPTTTNSSSSFSPSSTSTSTNTATTNLLSSPSTSSSSPSSPPSSPSSRPSPSSKNSAKKKRDSSSSLLADLSLFFRLFNLKMPTIVLLVSTLAFSVINAEPMYQRASYLSEGGGSLAYNPYSSNSVQQHLPAASEARPSVLKKPKNAPSSAKNNKTASAVRRTPQWTTMESNPPPLPAALRGPETMQYHFKTNHAVMVGQGRQALSSAISSAENLTAEESQLRKEKRQIGGVVIQQSETIYDPNQQQNPNQITQQLDSSSSSDGSGGLGLKHYQCDSIIRDSAFLIESPQYPSTYPVNRICTYYIARSRGDVCQIELNIVDMDIEDTAQCTADYLDLGGGQPKERLCGLMLRNTKRQISFPTNNSSYIRVTFHSDGQNGRPYRGFSAEVRQLSNSCFYPYHGVANGTQPQQVMVYGQRLYPPTRPLPPPPPQVWIGGPPGYPGARPEQYPGPVVPGATPTGTLFPPYMVNSSWGGNPPSSPQPQPLTPTFTFQQPQQPLPVQTTVNWSSGSSSVGVPGVVVQQQYPVTQVVSGRSNGSTSLNTGPVYLASYCDVFLGELSGELRSPGYPFGYPTNHSCIYTIRKAFDDVCQLELIFHHFDIQTPETGGGDFNNNNQPSNRRDLTDLCSGDYLELPDHSRLCGYYNQAMSRDHVLKKFYLFPDSSDYLFLQFLSDVHQRPDGSGFWLEARQLRNTCVPGAGGGVLQPSFTSSTNFPAANDSRPPKCDRLISGEFSTTERIYSPNYPNFYRPRSQCVYFIRPANERVCEFELDLANFQIEDSKPSGNSVTEHCNKDFLQLPDRTRICGRSNFRRIFSFPKYHDRTAMLYFSADEQVEDRGYEIVVRQLANSCANNSGGSYYPNTIATNLNPTGTAAGGNTQNVYIVNDPNIPQQQQPQSNHPRYNPTPVFTYHNSSGIQPAFYPYQPIYNPGSSTGGVQPQTVITQVVVPSSKTFGFGNGKKMSPLGPSYSLVPNVLNDPRNVDSSGTIPLYYANGSLATRVPPLKPVDMITFLKKGGKTFSVQKGGFSGGGTSPTLISGGSYAGFDGSGGGGKGFSIGNANYQPFGRLNEASGGSGSFTNRGFGNSNSLLSSDPQQQQQLTPSYNCDQVLSRPVEYIRSPNYPSNYPPVTRCIYTLLKAEPSVCQVRLHLLALDLEYTTGCRSDYLQIETTGEKLCGRLAGPETRTINFYGSARDVRLIFNSDRQLTAPGFEVRVEQVPNSCDSLENYSISNSNLSLASVATFSRIPNPNINNNQIDPRAARLININSGSGSSAEGAVTTSPMAAALSFSNRSGRLQQAQGTPTTPARLCSTSAALETFFETENFPNAYPTNTDCLFKIFRASRNVCRLEIELQAFDVGNEIYDSSSSSSNSLSPSGRSTTCPNDFLEIDQVKYCGRRPGQQIAVNFPRYAQEVAFRFLSISPDPFNGFRVRVQQIDKNCRSAASTAASNSNSLSFSGSSANSADELAEFSPATIESCSKIESPGGSFPGSSASSSASPSSPTAISERIIRIQSPKYGLATNLGYEPFLDCDYLVQRYSRDVCALEVKFEAFNVEESRACSKDYLEINGNVNSRMCGKMPVDTIRNFEFATETLRIHFHSDAERNDTGFAMVLKQIRC